VAAAGLVLSLRPRARHWRINTTEDYHRPAPQAMTTLLVIRWPQPPAAKRLCALSAAPIPYRCALRRSRMIAGTPMAVGAVEIIGVCC
jgi:hypothetical protein